MFGTNGLNKPNKVGLKVNADIVGPWATDKTPRAMRQRFGINPYIKSPSTKKPKIFSDSRRNKIAWERIVREIEPYSLYPAEEIMRLLKIYHFFLIYYLSEGFSFNIPYLGTFIRYTEEYEKPWFSRHRILADIEENKQHHTVGFRPSPFLSWYLNPTIYTPYRYQKVPSYFRMFEKFQKELCQSYHLSWYDIFPDKRYLEFSLAKLRCNGTIGMYAGVDWESPGVPKSARKRGPGRPAGSYSKIGTKRQYIPEAKKLIVDPYQRA